LEVAVVSLGLAGNAIQLVPDGTLLFHLAVIAVMVALLNATLLRPISRILEDRERRTKGRFAEAESIFTSVAEKLQEYESRLREARAEGYALLEGQRAAASRERELKVAEVKLELANWLQDEKQKLAKDAEQIRGKLAKDADTIATAIAAQILHRNVG
jgi:F-type H+-transporting ATPase subunit b